MSGWGQKTPPRLSPSHLKRVQNLPPLLLIFLLTDQSFLMPGLELTKLVFKRRRKGGHIRRGKSFQTRPGML